MEPISALAWTLGTGVSAAAAAMAMMVRRGLPEVAAVRAAEQHATVADLQRRLDNDGVVIRLTFVDSVVGPRLWLDADDLTATMSLFRAPGPGWARLQGTGAVLRSCGFVEPLGWHIELDTLDGHRSAVGWRFQVVPREVTYAPETARRD